MTTVLTTKALAITAPSVYAPDRNPAPVYLASLTASSRHPMAESLNLIATMSQPGTGYIDFAWHLLRYQHTQAIRTALAEKYSPATANRHLSALRGVLKESWRLGYVSAEEYQRAIDIKTIKGQTAKAAEKGRHIKSGESSALLDACEDDTKAGVRDACIIAIGYVCGLRRAELAGLMLEDYNRDDATLTIKHGKGNKERVIPVGGDGCDYLDVWIEVRGPWAGALFCPIDKADQLIIAPMTDQAIYYILERRIEKACVKSFTPHDLRRTFAGDLLDTGATYQRFKN